MPHLGRVGTLVVGALLALALLRVEAPAQKAEPHVNAHAAAMAEFQERIEAYTKLHDRVARDGVKMKPTEDPAEIRDAQAALAERLRQARKDARPGDIFTPEVRTAFYRLMYPKLTGPGAQETRATIRDDAPASVPLKVNATYPEAQPLPTVPPTMLANLPPLPKDLEYRIVGRHLILRDVDANLIVDFIPNAIR